MSLKAEDAFDVQDITDFLYSSTAYTGKSDTEKRRLIKAKLDDFNFAISTSPISKNAIEDLLGRQEGQDVVPEEVQGPAVSEGIIFVRAHYDGTSKTAKIKEGRSVCFDMTNGFCVTGVSENWGPDEYKVVGIALASYEVVDTIGKIPIKLIPPAAVSAEDTAIFVTRAKSGQSYPTYTATGSRRVFPARKIESPTWSAADPGNGAISGAESTDEFDVYQTSLNARFVLEGFKFVGWKINGKWYFDYLAPPIIQATLSEDLLLSSGSYASVQSGTLPTNVLAVSEKVKLIGPDRVGYKYPSGTVVLCALVGNEYCVVKTYTCPSPQ